MLILQKWEQTLPGMRATGGDGGSNGLQCFFSAGTLVCKSRPAMSDRPVRTSSFMQAHFCDRTLLPGPLNMPGHGRTHRH